MPLNRQAAIWLVVGSGVGAVLRNVVASAPIGIAALVANGAMTVLAGLFGGAAIGLLPGRAAAVMLGVSAGAASAGFYAVLGLTANLRVGILYLSTVPLLTAVAFTAGAVLAAHQPPRRRPSRRGKAPN